MTRTALILVLLAGCAAPTVGSQLQVIDLYPDEVYATLEAWTKVKGGPSNVDLVLHATIEYGTGPELTAMCHADPSIPLTGCTLTRHDGPFVIMIREGAATPWILAHEISHAIHGAVTGGDGDPHHTDLEIWGQTGIVNTATAAIERELATVSQPQ